MDTSVFVKKTNNIEKCKNNSEHSEHYENENLTISKLDILKCIPIDALRSENINLKNVKTEWRWRMFRFPTENGSSKEVIEISFVKPGQCRLYINKNSEWVQRIISDEYDIFLVDKYYHYVD